MILRFFQISELTDALIAQYYPLLSEKKRAKLRLLGDADERIEALCCEIVARQTLSALLDAPEFSFELLLNPGGRCVVGNYAAFISLDRAGDLLLCAASHKKVGVSLVKPAPFSFVQAQDTFTDRELRDIFSDVTQSFSQLIQMPEISVPAAVEKFAVYAALKYSAFRASGRFTGVPEKLYEFLPAGDGYVCLGRTDLKSKVGRRGALVYAVTEG